MQLLHRNDFGVWLNEAGLLGAGVEVGAAAGHFAAAVLAKWGGRQLTLIDPWETQALTAYIDVTNVGSAAQAVNRDAVTRLADADPRVRLLQGYSPAAAETFADESLDFVYLDANHAYLAVRADLHAWYPKVRPGGVFAGHDYLDGALATGLYGVKTAVDEFARRLGRVAAFTIQDAPWRSWFFRKPLGPPPTADRITVLTAYDTGFAALGDLARANREAYCGRHGYRFVCRTDGFDGARPPSWSKIRFILEELPHADWVFWTDADSLIMDSAVPLTVFLQDTVDLVLSDDPWHGLNAGCFFARNAPWTRAFLERVYEQTEFLDHRWWETAAIMALYHGEAQVRRHAAVVPNKLFNGYPYDGGNYVAGDFLAHFPGMPDREYAMRNYAAMAR